MHRPYSPFQLKLYRQTSTARLVSALSIANLSIHANPFNPTRAWFSRMVDISLRTGSFPPYLWPPLRYSHGGHCGCVGVEPFFSLEAGGQSACDSHYQGCGLGHRAGRGCRFCRCRGSARRGEQAETSDDHTVRQESWDTGKHLAGNMRKED